MREFTGVDLQYAEDFIQRAITQFVPMSDIEVDNKRNALALAARQKYVFRQVLKKGGIDNVMENHFTQQQLSL